MKKWCILVLIYVCMICLLSCSGGGGGGDDDIFLGYIDIINAKTLFAVDDNTSSTHYFKLKKVINNGTEDIVEDVVFYDEKKNVIKKSDDCPYVYGNNSTDLGLIKRINDKYIVLGNMYFSGNDYVNQFGALLCRLEDGKCVNIGAFYSSDDYSARVEYPKTWVAKDNIDYMNNLYLAHEYDGMEMISLNSLNFDSVHIIPTVISIPNSRNYLVSKSGNIVYRYYNNHSGGWKIRTKDGSILDLVVSNNGNLDIWRGNDGDIYFQEFIDNEPPQPIKKITINDLTKEVQTDVYSDFTEYIDYFFRENSFLINISDYTYLISNSYDYTHNQIYELYNLGATPRIINFPGLTINEVYAVAQTEDYYYIAGKDSSSRYFIIKVTPGTTDYEQVLGDGYKVNNLTASKWNGITFSAERMADGKSIVANISNSGDMKILDISTSQYKIVSLESLR